MDSFQLNVADIRYSGKLSESSLTSIVVSKSSDEPLNIHVDTDTDWAAISPSIAGVIVTLLVAWLTLRLQRKQTISNLSGLRQQWMSELRMVSSEYLQLIYKTAMRIDTMAGFKGSEAYLMLYESIVVTGSRLEMLLSRDDADTKAINDLDQKILDSLDDLKQGEDCQFILDMLDQLKHLIRKELESAWNDIKSDVGIISQRKSATKFSTSTHDRNPPEVT